MNEEVRLVLEDFLGSVNATISRLRTLSMDHVELEVHIGPTGRPPVVGSGCNIANCQVGSDGKPVVTVRDVIELLEQVRGALL